MGGLVVGDDGLKDDEWIEILKWRCRFPSCLFSRFLLGRSMLALMVDRPFFNIPASGQIRHDFRTKE